MLSFQFSSKIMWVNTSIILLYTFINLHGSIIKKIVILHTVKKITVIIQWITVTESRYLSALTYTIICCVCVIGLVYKSKFF